MLARSTGPSCTRSAVGFTERGPAPLTLITAFSLTAARVWLVRQAGKAFASRSCSRITIASMFTTSRKAPSGPFKAPLRSAMRSRTSISTALRNFANVSVKRR